MPSVANFYGIVIYMYRDDAGRHHLPHIHAMYQGKSAVIAVKTGRVLDGKLPPAKLRMVQTWVDMRREDLLTDWELAVNSQTLFKIKPLE